MIRIAASLRGHRGSEQLTECRLQRAEVGGRPPLPLARFRGCASSLGRVIPLRYRCLQPGNAGLSLGAIQLFQGVEVIAVEMGPIRQPVQHGLKRHEASIRTRAQLGEHVRDQFVAGRRRIRRGD